jgi:hypothetical protein
MMTITCYLVLSHIPSIHDFDNINPSKMNTCMILFLLFHKQHMHKRKCLENSVDIISS